MPWYAPEDGPWDYEFDSYDDGDLDLIEDPAESLDWLRSKRPRFKSSTYDANSDNAVLGGQAERIVRRELRVVAARLDSDVKIDLWNEARYLPFSTGPFDSELSAYGAIDNAKNGDIYLVDGKRIRFSIEVKTSLKYDNASISETELLHSEAKYLIALTTAGLWACTMEEARRHAREVKTNSGSFWIVQHQKVKQVSLEEIVSHGRL